MITQPEPSPEFEETKRGHLIAAVLMREKETRQWPIQHSLGR